MLAGKRLAYSDHFLGYSLFVSAAGTRVDTSMKLAGALGDSLLSSGFTPSLHHAVPIPGENRVLLDRSRGIYRFDDLIVLRTAGVPAVLLEAGVIVNRREEETIRSENDLVRRSTAITRGILSFCSTL